ncbi:MAG TPA: hypothetical protein VGD84_03455 [Pseudonocardiaceae bacterium]
MTASTAPSRPAQPRDVQRNGLGLSALGVGVGGVLLGVFAGGAWFVVVPLGLLALIFGVFGLAQKRYYATVDVTPAVIGMIAGAVTLALGVWGTGTFLDGLHQTADTTPLTGSPVAVAQGPAASPLGHPSLSRPAGPPWTTGGTITWGQPHSFGDNLVVAVSAPITFSPPSVGGSVRSVVISVTITNCATTVYHPDKTMFDPGATFDGRSLSQVTLPGGTVDAPKATAIQPGQSMGYRVAYALPSQHGELWLTLRPNPSVTQAVIGGQT